MAHGISMEDRTPTQSDEDLRIHELCVDVSIVLSKSVCFIAVQRVSSL